MHDYRAVNMPHCQISGMEEKCPPSPSGGGLADGLKFGKKIYFEGLGSGLQPKSGPSPVAAPPPSPAKKGRTGLVQGGHPPRCQVEGCKVDLSDAKTYYSRHKVCGMHSKSPKVIVAGIEQRFCQQCSRFHLLHEFDQGKRSCRRRLAGHNERRRKPPPGSLLSARCRSICESMFDDYSRSGGFVMDFSAYSNIAGRDSWPNAISECILENQAATTGKSQFKWQCSSQNTADFLDSTSRFSYSGPGVSPEECYTGGVSESSSALSLLSNQLWCSKNSSSGFGVSSYLCTSESVLVQPSINPGAAVGQVAFSPSWVLKVNQANEALHKWPPDLSLGQTSASSQYSGELGLAQPSEEQFHHLEQSRSYDSSVQHMHWSL